MKIEKLYKSKDLFPVVKGTDEHLFINPLCAVLKAQSEVYNNSGVDVATVVDGFTYDDKTTKLTKSLKSFIEKSVVEMSQFHYSREFNERDADEEIKKFSKYVDLYDKMTFKPTSRDDYNVSFTLANSTNLYNSVLAGGHPTKRANLPYRIGKYGKLSRFEQKYEVTDEEIVHNMYNPKFLSDINEEKLNDWFTQLNEVLTVGEYNSSYTLGDPSTGLMDGLETLLATDDGTYKNSDGRVADPLMGRKYIKPSMLDINKILGTAGKEVEDLSGQEIYSVLDYIVKFKVSNKYLRTNIKSAKFYLDANSLFKYNEFRGEPVASTTPNVLQEKYRNNGGVFLHKGYKVETLTYMSGDYVIFGDIEEYKGFMSSNYKEIREYKPELEGGDSGFAFYRKGWLSTVIRDGSKFIVAGSSKPLSNPMILSDYNINATDLTGTTGGSDLEVYPISTVIGGEIHYTTDGSTPIKTSTELREGNKVVLTSGETLKVVVYRNSEISGVVSYSVA